MDYVCIADGLGRADWFMKKLEDQIDEFNGERKAYFGLSENLIDQKAEISHLFSKLKKSYMSIIDGLLAELDDNESNLQRERNNFDKKVSKLQKKIRELEADRKNDCKTNGDGDVKTRNTWM